jgi:hypothetical protein
MFNVEQFWAAILSGEPALVQEAFQGLPQEEQTAVIAHLQEMVTGEGWAAIQRDSAQTALSILQTPPTA